MPIPLGRPGRVANEAAEVAGFSDSAPVPKVLSPDPGSNFFSHLGIRLLFRLWQPSMRPQFSSVCYVLKQWRL